MFFKYANFGGFIRFGDKTIAVTGKTLKKIAEFESYWVSLCIPWRQSLMTLLHECPHLATQDFINKWMMAFRKSFYAKGRSLQHKLANESILGLRFEVWQCCRDEYTIDEIDEILDSMTHDELVRFAKEFDHKLEIASGGSSEGNLSELMRLIPKQSGENPDHTTESMIATLIKHKMIGPPESILNLTPAQVSAMLTDPDRLENDLMLETMIPEKGPEYARNMRIYGEEADKILRMLKVPTANVDINNASSASGSHS